LPEGNKIKLYLKFKKNKIKFKTAKIKKIIPKTSGNYLKQIEKINISFKTLFKTLRGSKEIKNLNLR